MIAVMAIVSRASTMAWRASSRHVQIQTWHLEQLLPATPALPAPTPGLLC